MLSLIKRRLSAWRCYNVVALWDMNQSKGVQSSQRKVFPWGSGYLEVLDNGTKEQEHLHFGQGFTETATSALMKTEKKDIKLTHPYTLYPLHLQSYTEKLGLKRVYSCLVRVTQNFILLETPHSNE